MPLRPTGGSKRDRAAASLRAPVTWISNYPGIILLIFLVPQDSSFNCKQSQGSNLVFLKIKEVQTVKKRIWLPSSSDSLKHNHQPVTHAWICQESCTKISKPGQHNHSSQNWTWDSQSTNEKSWLTSLESHEKARIS